VNSGSSIHSVQATGFSKGKKSIKLLGKENQSNIRGYVGALQKKGRRNRSEAFTLAKNPTKRSN